MNRRWKQSFVSSARTPHTQTKCYLFIFHFISNEIFIHHISLACLFRFWIHVFVLRSAAWTRRVLSELKAHKWNWYVKHAERKSKRFQLLIFHCTSIYHALMMMRMTIIIIIFSFELGTAWIPSFLLSPRVYFIFFSSLLFFVQIHFVVLNKVDKRSRDVGVVWNEANEDDDETKYEWRLKSTNNSSSIGSMCETAANGRSYKCWIIILYFIECVYGHVEVATMNNDGDYIGTIFVQVGTGFLSLSSSPSFVKLRRAYSPSRNVKSNKMQLTTNTPIHKWMMREAKQGSGAVKPTLRIDWPKRSTPQKHIMRKNIAGARALALVHYSFL